MKKLFTLVALLAMVLGANAQAQWEEVYKIDYSTYQGFPNYVMGYVPEWVGGVMTDYGAMYKYTNKKDEDAKEEGAETSDVIVKANDGTEYYKISLTSPAWHQYIIAAGVPMLLDETYKVKAVVKATEAVNANLQFGNWGALKETGVAIPAADEFQEVEWEVAGCQFGGDGFICIQPGTSTATIEWQSLTVYHKMKEGQRPKEWLEDIENGNAEKSWEELGLADVKFDDNDNNFKVCAWGKEKGVNMNEKDGWDPFPATIEADPDDATNKVFVVHGKKADSAEGAAWDNQFWIQSQHAWTPGLTVKIKFRYKASKEVEVETQTHKQKPSDYLIWHGIGNVTFKEEWQTFEKDVTFADDMANGWSFAFNLNAKDTDPIDFYFDDLSWKYLKLDHGFFVSGINATTTTSYDDLDNAIAFENEGGLLVATVGTAGDEKTYVDQIMISTICGDDQAFKGATLKPDGKIQNDPDNWMEYTASTNAKLDLPGLGVWKVYLDLEYTSMAFEMIEGTEYEEVEIVPNPTVVVVNGQERDYLPADKDGNPVEAEIGTGAAWDNQFFLISNRPLKAGETTVLQFKYKASKEAKTTTQCHGAPGAYMHWGCIGDVTFTEEWQDFEKEYTVPSEADGMKSIAFNMAEIKDACDYEIKDFVWMSGKEWLIDETGAKNFWVKEGAGTAPHMFGAKEFDITTAETVNGTVEVGAKAYELQTITITAKPAEGYSVDAVTVTCATIDQVVEVENAGDNKFTFEMPADAVTVTVTFKEGTGINNITANKVNSTVIYNLAGQRVDNGFKGIVIKDGKKFVK